MSKKAFGIVSDIFFLLLGGALFGMSLNLFFIPGEIILGGVTGIATAFNILSGLPVGFLIIIINLPIIILGVVFLGSRFVLRSFVGVAVTGAASDLLVFLPMTVNDPLLCAILGGVTMGAGCGLMFSHGYTTGGTDIIVWIIRQRIKRLSTGTLITLIDGAVILSSALLLKNAEGIFYSAVSLFFFAVSLDYVMRGSDRGKLAFIFSEKSDEICSLISAELGRGISLLYGRGWYSAKERPAVVCAVRKNESRALAELVDRVDPGAFVIFTEASEIRGLGFGEAFHRKNDVSP